MALPGTFGNRNSCDHQSRRFLHVSVCPEFLTLSAERFLVRQLRFGVTTEAVPTELEWPASAIREALRSGLTEAKKSFLGFFAVIISILAGNVAYLSGFSKANPALQLSGLGQVTVPGRLNGLPTIDPNIAYTSDALGHYAALQMLHFHLAWWNPFEGFGQPLIGELQSAALLPLTLLQALPNGLFLMHLSMELIAGLSTFLLLRRIGLTTVASVAAGVGFGLCGTFSWLGNAVVNPVAFLPLAILGVELARDAALKKRRFGWLTLALAFALAVAAGFPEVAFYDTLLVALWAAVRMVGEARPHWLAISKKLIMGAGVGFAIALPIIVAFASLVAVGSTGGHHGDNFANSNLPPQSRPLLLMPYAYGLVWNPTSPTVSGLAEASAQIGGYLGVPMFFLAVVSMFGQRLRGLRLVLGGWAFAAISASWGLFFFHQLFNLLPGEKVMVLARYIPASFEFACLVLAAMAIDDLRRRAVSKVAITSATAVAVLALIWSINGSSPLRAKLFAVGAVNFLTKVGIVWPVVALFAMFGVWFLTRGKLRVAGVAIVLMVDLMASFAIPQLAAPRQATLVTGSIEFLKANLGGFRYYGLGVPQANYATYYQLLSINADDLPVPKAFIDYEFAHLDPNGRGNIFNGANRTDPAGISAVQAFTERWHEYAKVGVKYVVTSRPALGDSPFVGLGLQPVYRDARVVISELPHPRPILTGSAGCTVTAHGLDSATVNCTQPGTVTRTVLTMPGWTATVDGDTTPIATVEEAFQQISVPAGRHEISYSFLPNHVALSLLVSAGGLSVFGSGAISTLRAARRRTRPPREVILLDEVDELSASTEASRDSSLA